MSGAATKQAPAQKAQHVAVKAAGAVTADDLAAIRTYTLRDITAEEVVVREYDLCHNCIDRDSECFDEALLADMARTLPGKGIFIRHPGGWDGDTGPGDGRVFSAQLVQMSLDDARTRLRQPNLTLPPDRSTVTLLTAKGYFSNLPEDQKFHARNELGIAGDVSVGFTHGDRDRLKGADGIELNAWRLNGPGEGLEMSYVWLGAQPGARATKGATRNPEPAQDDDMSAEKLATAENTIKTLQPQADALKAAQTALGDNAALLNDPAALAAVVADGKAFRAGLIDGLVAADRVAGDVGDDDEAVKAAKAAYEAMPTAALKAIDARNARASKSAPVEQGIKGSDPNAGKHTPPDAKTAEQTPAIFQSKAFNA